MWNHFTFMLTLSSMTIQSQHQNITAYLTTKQNWISLNGLQYIYSRDSLLDPYNMRCYTPHLLGNVEKALWTQTVTMCSLIHSPPALKVRTYKPLVRRVWTNEYIGPMLAMLRTVHSNQIQEQSYMTSYLHVCSSLLLCAM